MMVKVQVSIPVVILSIIFISWVAGISVGFRKTSLQEGFVYTPVGPLPADCVYEVDNGAHVFEGPDGLLRVKDPITDIIKIIPPCKKDIRKYIAAYLTKRMAPEVYDGWLAFTSWQCPAASGTFDSFLGYFTVPVAPQNPPEVLYLFTGLQNVNWIPIVDPEPTIFDIIQPVLQYPGDNGNYWSVKSWYVTLDQGAIASPEIVVAVGSEVFGNMTRTGAESWFIGGTNAAGELTKVDISRPRLAKQPWAYNTAEGYGVLGCTYEPTNSCSFTQLAITSGGTGLTPVWQAFQSPTPKCAETAHINSPSSVDITFQKTN